MIGIVVKKELKSFFQSPSTYIIAALFAVTMGWIFFNLLMDYIETYQNIPDESGQWSFINTVVMKLFGNMNFLFLFISPLMTMRLFAEEKRDSTLELYFASPIKDFQLVVGKYLSSLIMGLFLLSTTFVFPILMSSVNLEDFSFVICGYFGLFLNLACYFAIGMMASSMTSNQIVAALLTLFCILFFWMLTWLSKGSSNYILVQITSYLSMISHFESFAKGVLSLSDMVYYFSFVGLCLFATNKIIGARNW